MPLRHLDSIARALDAEISVAIRWRGGDLDRLLDEGHAALGGQLTAWLSRFGWEIRPEVTFSIWGEHGAIDLLALHEATGTLLVVEVKTELASVEETLRRHDAKVRLADRIATDQRGWTPRAVARLLVLPDGATARRRVERHEVLLARSYPLRGRELRRSLRAPRSPMSGLIFVSFPRGMRDRQTVLSRKRIRHAPVSVAGLPDRPEPRPNTSFHAPHA